MGTILSEIAVGLTKLFASGSNIRGLCGSLRWWTRLPQSWGVREATSKPGRLRRRKDWGFWGQGSWECGIRASSPGGFLPFHSWFPQLLHSLP